MRITVTATIGELLEAGLWDRVCTLKGWDPWYASPAEGRTSEDQEVSLTQYEAEELGIIPREVASR